MVRYVIHELYGVCRGWGCDCLLYNGLTPAPGVGRELSGRIALETTVQDKRYLPADCVLSIRHPVTWLSQVGFVKQSGCARAVCSFTAVYNEEPSKPHASDQLSRAAVLSIAVSSN